MRPEDRDEEAERTELLVKFKAKLKDPSSGHTVAEFSGPYELASIAASDLHNWLVEKFLAPAIREATGGQAGAEPLHSLERGLRELAAINPDLQRKAATERSKAEALRRVALEAFYPLTYEVPKILAQFPGTEGQREQFVRKNLASLDSRTSSATARPKYCASSPRIIAFSARLWWAAASGGRRMPLTRRVPAAPKRSSNWNRIMPSIIETSQSATRTLAARRTT